MTESIHEQITRKAFMAGFDAGVEDTFDRGMIICDDFKREVTERAWQDFASSKQAADLI